MDKSDGGYDDGYRAVPCFWGTRPGSLITKFLSQHPTGSSALVLDLGCGEGKNAAAFTKAGYSVDAIDCSTLALENGKRKFANSQIRWLHEDIRDVNFPSHKYQVVVAYGFFHCLRNLDEISAIIGRTKDATKTGGHHLVCAFNNRTQDLSGHPGFVPTLAAHSWYVGKYSDWNILSATDTILCEQHPHNKIPHHHSITRLVARRLA